MTASLEYLDIAAVLCNRLRGVVQSLENLHAAKLLSGIVIQLYHCVVVLIIQGHSSVADLEISRGGFRFH